MDLIRRVVMKRAEEKKWLKKFEEFTPGDTVKVYVRIKEGEKERVQVYKGVVIKVQGKGLGKSFTVRKISSGVGVERTFPFSSPQVEKVELVSRGEVRRSRLYYLRDLKGRAARLTSELVVSDAETAGEAISAAGSAGNASSPTEESGTEEKTTAKKKAAQATE